MVVVSYRRSPAQHDAGGVRGGECSRSEALSYVLGGESKRIDAADVDSVECAGVGAVEPHALGVVGQGTSVSDRRAPETVSGPK